MRITVIRVDTVPPPAPVAAIVHVHVAILDPSAEGRVARTLTLPLSVEAMGRSSLTLERITAELPAYPFELWESEGSGVFTLPLDSILLGVARAESRRPN